jgi:hypothetical protein
MCAHGVLPLQEALRSPSPVARNNCLVAVCDMAIHFTALVDSHLPRLAGLIRDPHELVRKQVGFQACMSYIDAAASLLDPGRRCMEKGV